VLFGSLGGLLQASSVSASHHSHANWKVIPLAQAVYVRHPILLAVPKLLLRPNRPVYEFIPYGFTKYSGVSVGKLCKGRFLHAIIKLKCIHFTACTSTAHLEIHLYCILLEKVNDLQSTVRSHSMSRKTIHIITVMRDE
jgi:hypothetical protein